MKTRTATLATIGIGLANTLYGQSSLIGFDGFNYSNGLINGKTGGSNWNAFGGASSWDGTASILNGALVTNTNITASREYGGDETASAFQPSGQIFFRVTMTFGNELPAFALISSFDLGTESMSFGRHGQTWIIERPSGGSYGFAHNILPNSTTTIIGVMDYTNHITALFVDPDGSDFYDDGGGTADARWSLSLQAPWSTRVGLKSEGDPASPVRWDNLAVGKTFAAVNTIPEPGIAGLLFAGLLVCAKSRPKWLRYRL